MRALLLAALLLAAPPIARAANPVVRFTTTLGSYDVELCQELSAACPGVAPATVANFLRYVDEDRYPATSIIHRSTTVATAGVVVIQGGGFWIEGYEDGTFDFHSITTLPPIALELGAGLSNLRATIAMARSADPNSATSQWFINLVDNTALDTAGGGYAVFGEVVAGLDVVDAIGALPVYLFGSPFGELPLNGWPGGVSVEDYFVYVPSVERVPEPSAAAGGLAGTLALAALARATRGRARR